MALGSSDPIITGRRGSRTVSKRSLGRLISLMRWLTSVLGDDEDCPDQRCLVGGLS